MSAIRFDAWETLDDKNVFEELRAKRVKSGIFLADVPFMNRGARP